MEPYMWTDLLEDYAPDEARMTTKDVPLRGDYSIEYILLTESDLTQLRTGHILCIEVGGGEYTLVVGMAGD